MTTSTATTVEPVIHHDVMEWLQRFDCVDEFWDRIALARDVVPDVRKMEVRVVHDPDEEGRAWIDITATVPADVGWERCLTLANQYIDETVKRGYPCRFPISFVLNVESEAG